MARQWTQVFTIVIWLMAASGLAQSPRGLFLIDVTGGPPEEITPKIDLAYGSANFSHQGDRIVFDAWPATSSYVDSRVYALTLSTKELKDFGPGAFPSWSPDDKQILFRSGANALSIVVVNADGTGRETLPIRGNSPRWSPDGRYIAYLESNPHGLAIYDAAVGRSAPIKRVTLFAYWGGAWSADGQAYCFPAAKQMSLPDSLVIADLQSANSSLRNLHVRYSGPEIGTNMGWSKEGDQIVFFSRVSEDDKFQLYTISARGDEAPRRIEGQDPQRSNTDPAWSPDGKRIIFTSSR